MISTKAGFLFINRSVIDEDGGSEVLKILELEKTSWKIENREDINFEKHMNQKGIGRFIMLPYSTNFTMYMLRTFY